MERLWLWPLVVVLYVLSYLGHWITYPFLTRTHYTIYMKELATFPMRGYHARVVAKALSKDATGWAGQVKISRTPTCHPDVWRWTFKYDNTIVVVKSLEQ